MKNSNNDKSRNNSHKFDSTRRNFLQKSVYASLLGGGAAAFNSKLSMMNDALAMQNNYADFDDYKALVCVFLYGGSDSFNLFIPPAGNDYNKYVNARGEIALEGNQFIEAAASGQNESLRFHSNLTGLRDIYQDGNLAVVRNVGNLIEPVTRNSIMNGNPRIPIDLFAHNSQQEQVLKSYSSRPAGAIGAGWGGRMADLLTDAEYQSTTLPPTYSLNDTNFFLPGDSTTPISVNPATGPNLLQFLDETRSSSNTNRDNALGKILDLYLDDDLPRRDHLIENFAASSFDNARKSSRILSDVIANNTNAELNIPWNSSNQLDVQLRMVARMIAGRTGLRKRRPVFFVGMGGWDTHKDQALRFNTLTSQLNEGLSNFQAALKSLGVENDVTTFTASDFGRTLTLNTSGTDHGWGGHYLVMGGAVNGGMLYGEWPDYNIDSQDDLGLGRIIPKISINQYGAALARWMDLEDNDLFNTVFPDLAAFDDQVLNGLFS